jgi:hypothetical protein
MLSMRRILRVLFVVAILLLAAGAWFWWNSPQTIDMATNVPADSLVYLEANSLADVARAIGDTDAFQNLAPALGMKQKRWQDPWLNYLARITGIGSAESVIAARAQVAVAILDLNANGAGDTLEFKPLAALVVETHTSANRIRPALEHLLGSFAQRAYGQPTLEHVNSGDAEFLEWIAPGGARRIVATIDGTTVIIGNDERAVSACLAARRGQRPSLYNQAELQQMRSRLAASSALAFGYVSSANAARLLSIATPLLFGKLPEESQLQKLLSVGASKVLDGAGWSARPFAGGIEDRYAFSLKPAVVSRLRSSFAAPPLQHQTWELLPVGTYSLTSYNLRDPALTWDSLNAAVSSQVDALTAVIFTSASKASLLQYGVDDPPLFLRAVQSEILTVRLEPGSARPVVIATVGDERALREFISHQLGPKSRLEQLGKNQILISADNQSAAAFIDHQLIMGSADDVHRCLASRAQGAAIIGSPESLKAVTKFVDLADTADVVTYTNDSERVRAFFAGWNAIRGTGSGEAIPTDGERVMKGLPYAVTETRLGEFGFERRTRSPLGQFSSLLSLLTPATTAAK